MLLNVRLHDEGMEVVMWKLEVHSQMVNNRDQKTEMINEFT